MGRKKLAFVLCAMLFLAACETGEETAQGHAGHQETFRGDIRETTAGVSELPSFLQKHDDQMKMIYLAAAQNQDLLEWIPCYCGCGQSVNHRNNLECFVNKTNENGTVVWDDHATRCNTCLAIAVESINMKTEGKTVKEIRQYIDEKYKVGYAQPTDTPLPQ